MKKSDLPPQVLPEYERLQSRAGGKIQDAICRGSLPRVSTRYRSEFETIAPIPCVDCGQQAQTYDHRDYLAPLAVEPVCDSCNYRRGMAADTFTNHSEYWTRLGFAGFPETEAHSDG